MKCNICESSYSEGEGVQCASCSKQFDFGCASITEAGWKRLGAERRSNWKCSACRAPSPVPMPIKDPVTLDNVMKEILDVKQKLAGLPTVYEDIKSIKAELGDLKSSCEFTSSKIKELTTKLTCTEKKVADLELKCSTLESSLIVLKVQISNHEHRTRLNNVEIKGVPYNKDENLFNILDSIGNMIEYQVNRSQINYISRIPSYNAKEKPILVSFINRYVKEDFIAYARAKKSIKAEDIGFQNSTKQIYINDHLSAETKLLLNKTREIAKIKEIAYVWVKFGKIHVRKNDTSRIFVVSKLEDLNKLT